MPLITLTTKADWHPFDGRRGNDFARPAMIAMFAEALPALFVANILDLHMDANTPEAGVQVTHRNFHHRDVNTPDMWILIEFSEGNLSDTVQRYVASKVKDLLLNWFLKKAPEILTIDYAVDVRWSPSHGFLKIGDTTIDW